MPVQIRTNGQSPLDQNGLAIHGALRPDGQLYPEAANADGASEVALKGKGSFGHGKIASTASPVALPARACDYVDVIADEANLTTLLVGNSVAQEIPLRPGDSYRFLVNNANLIYHKRATAVTCNIIYAAF